MGKAQLTAQQVRAKSRQDGLHRVAPGLYLRVRGASAIWTIRATTDGKTKERSLGPFDSLSLADAVAKTATVRAQLKRGESAAYALPSATKSSVAKPDDTFRGVAEKLWSSLRDGWSNEKHASQWISTLRTYAYPKLGDQRVADITTQDVFDVLTANGLWKDKHETATRLRQRIEAVLSAAKASGLRDAPNAAAWHDNLKPLLPSIAKRKRVVHHPALPWRDLPPFMAELRRRAHMSSWALQFTILTGLRTGAILGARWPELSLNEELPKWVVPKNRMKTRAEFFVPLSKQAVELLQNIPRLEGSDVVFWGQAARKARPEKPKGTIGPLSNMAMLELLQGMRPGKTVHGFRSSFRDWAADTTNYQSEIVEMALSHSISDDVEAAYRRGDLFARRMPLMQDWADYLDSAEAHKKPNPPA